MSVFKETVGFIFQKNKGKKRKIKSLFILLKLKFFFIESTINKGKN